MTQQKNLKWQVPEYPEYSRGMRWFIATGLIGVVFLIYAIYTGNFLFAVIIIMGVLISVLSSYKKPQDVAFELSADGVRFGENFFPWKKFQSYWTVDEDSEYNLGLDLKNWLLIDIYVPVKNNSLEEVEKFVAAYLSKNPERKSEPISYFLGRKLKI